MQICSSGRCAVTQHQCTAALVWTKYLPPLLCAALQKKLTAGTTSLQIDLLRDLCLAQVCGGPTPMHCSTGQGRIASPLFVAALQTRLTAALCHCKYTYGDLLCTQSYSDATPKQCSTGQGRIASPLVQCCSAIQARRMLAPLQLHLWRFALHTGVQ